MITISDLRQWLEQTNEPILSLYLVVDPALPENQAATPSWRSWAKTALREIENELDERQSSVWFETHRHLEDFLESYTPNSKMLVLFCGKASLEMCEFAVPLNNYSSFGEPALTPLVHAINQHKPYVITLLDHESARIWLVALDRIEYEKEMRLEVHRKEWHKMTLKPAPALSGYVKAGSNRDRFAHRVEEQIERFYTKVAEQTLRLGKKHQVEYIVLAGNQESNHALHNHMPDQTVIGPIPVANYLSSSDVLKKVSPIVMEYEQEQEIILVEKMIHLAKSGGRCVLGANVLTALEQRCVELLLVPWPSANEKLVDKLTLDGLAAGAEVRPMGGKAGERLIAECGVAARLYYRESA